MNPGAWSNPAYAAIAAFVHKRTGLSFPAERRGFAESAIRRTMRKVRIGEPLAFLTSLLAGNHVQSLVDELMVGETYFFREPSQFEFLRRHVLPELRKQRNEHHCLRAWSAGCASGEEAYSLAILFEEEGFGGRATILATDISQDALRRAKAGVYGSWSLRGSEAERLGQYVERSSSSFVVAPRFRQRVRFQPLNLVGDPYPDPGGGTSSLDLILCRNVVIYFDSATAQRVLRRLVSCLAPGGWLVIGPSDPLLIDDGTAEIVSTEHGIFYRRRTEPARPPAAAYVSRRPQNRPKAVSASDAPRSSFAMPDLESRSSEKAIAEAQIAFDRGDYSHAIALVRGIPGPTARLIEIRSHANSGETEIALQLAEEAAKKSLDSEVHFVHGTLLMSLGRIHEAAAAMRRVLYLEPRAAGAQLALASILERLGDGIAAGHAYGCAYNALCRLDADETVPLSEGERVDRLIAVAKSGLDRLARGASASSR